MNRTITFKKSEKDLYEFLCSKRNPSVYVKDLIEADMKGISLSVTNNAIKNTQIIEVEEEENNEVFMDF